MLDNFALKVALEKGYHKIADLLLTDPRVKLKASQSSQKVYKVPLDAMDEVKVSLRRPGAVASERR
jgi:hypothetical protein